MHNSRAFNNNYGVHSIFFHPQLSSDCFLTFLVTQVRTYSFKSFSLRVSTVKLSQLKKISLLSNSKVNCFSLQRLISEYPADVEPTTLHSQVVQMRYPVAHSFLQFVHWKLAELEGCAFSNFGTRRAN